MIELIHEMIDRLETALHPEAYITKSKARRLLRRAVYNGDLVKLSCEVCGSAVSEGHHPDYKYPLDVVWLCKSHHSELHRYLRAEQPRHVDNVGIYE